MPRKKNKNPPVMSHEFVIQNHADIVSCSCIVIILGLIFESTAKISRLFIFLQYGIKEEDEETPEGDIIEKFPTDFERGWLDGFTIFFQALIVIVIHAVVQEYVVDKMTKKLHLSKTKTSKFNESGQLSVWTAISAAWAIYCVQQSNLLPNVSSLWHEYPHTIMRWENKLFMLGQMAYWLHMFPELYLQKIRKEELSLRIRYYSLYFFFIFAAYFMNFWRFCIVTLALHYPVECLFHVSRMMYFAEKGDAQLGFHVWSLAYPLVRFLILSLTVLVFWFGLGGLEDQAFGPAQGNFNSSLIRTISMTAMCLLQLWLMWNFIQLQFRRRRDQQAVQQALKKKTSAPKSKSAKKAQKKSVESEEDDSRVSNGKVKRN